MRKFFALIFIVLFVLSSLPTLLFFSFYQAVGSRDVYRSYLVHSLYDFLDQHAEDGLKRLNLPYLEEMDVPLIIRGVLPRKNLEIIIQNELDKVFGQQLVDSGVFTIDMPLDFLRDRAELFSGEVANYLYSKLQFCSDENVAISNLSCLPQDISEDDYAARLTGYFQKELFSQVPERFSLDVDFQLNEDVFSGGTLLDLVSYLFKTSLIVLLLVNLVFLLVLVLFFHYSWMVVLRWLSYAFMMASSLWLVFILLLNYVLIPELDYFFIQNFLFLIRNIILQITVPVFIISLGFSCSLFLLAEE